MTPQAQQTYSNTEERMVFHGASIPLELKRPSQIRRVTMAEDIVIPPMVEIIGQAYICHSCGQLYGLAAG